MATQGLGHSLLTGLAGSNWVPSMHESSMWERFVFQLGALSGEYLFFIGASLMAALLLARRRWVGATAVFGLAVLWLTFHLPVSLYLESLGADSFAEVRQFDLDEARFWAQTMGETVQPDFSLKKFLAYLAVSVISFYGLRWMFHRRGLSSRLYVLSKLGLSMGLMALAFHQTTAKALAFYLENTEKFHATAANFSHPPPQLKLPAQPVDLVVYIGESTTTMNLQLYGYARPTTPELSRMAAMDPQLLVFDHVFATHAHTSRSLLEALSFGVDDSQKYLPITERRRISVVDVLRTAGVQPRLLSNQGQGGSWDQASSVIFRHSHNTFRTRAQAADTPWDDEFFEAQLRALEPPPAGKPQVVFLHSYAGHGPYHLNIAPRFRQPVDAQLQQLSPEQVVRNPGVSLERLEQYDAAMRYVDFSVSKTLQMFKHAERPTIVLYFADHGEGVYAGLGHDSARFRHEMARVPLLIYFNDAAARARPQQLARYRQLAGTGHTATLAQLPSTLLDLLGARILDAQTPMLQTPVVGEAAELPPIMVRQTVEGITFVNLSGQPAPAVTPLGLPLFDRTDEDTRRYIEARTHTQVAQQACKQPARTLEEMSRHTLVLRCPAEPLLASRGRP